MFDINGDGDVEAEEFAQVHWWAVIIRIGLDPNYLTEPEFFSSGSGFNPYILACYIRKQEYRFFSFCFFCRRYLKNENQALSWREGPLN